MSLRNTLLFSAIELPAYWRACRLARKKMSVTEERITYGEANRQYAIVVRGANYQPGRFAFYFHGGAWTFGRPEAFVPAAIPWLEMGYTVVLPSYRRPPLVGMHEIVTDCRAAIAAVAPAGEVTDLHIGGISAGAHLAALLALKPDWWRVAGWPMSPQKILLCAGPLVLADLWPQSLFRKYKEFDPHALLPKASNRPGWQLLHGRNDATVPYAHSRKFHERLLARGHKADLLTLPRGTHLDSGRWMFGGAGAEQVRKFLGAEAH